MSNPYNPFRRHGSTPAPASMFTRRPTKHDARDPKAPGAESLKVGEIMLTPASRRLSSGILSWIRENLPLNVYLQCIEKCPYCRTRLQAGRGVVGCRICQDADECGRVVDEIEDSQLLITLASKWAEMHPEQGRSQAHRGPARGSDADVLAVEVADKYKVRGNVKNGLQAIYFSPTVKERSHQGECRLLSEEKSPGRGLS